MRPETPAHLWDAAEAARLVTVFVQGKTLTIFESDVLIRSAVERQLEILGEALNRLRRADPATGTRVPNLDQIIGMRNIIAHEYGEIDYEIVWRAATTRVPGLLSVLGGLLEELGQGV
jgi:uncharacterized protein with HEPN domain